jgi:deoxyribodipyrimidine photo-lyase
MIPTTAVVLLTRDLRVHDNPALAAACANAERVVPLFVFDPALGHLSANRARFLHQCVADLRERLRERGGDLVVRVGDPVAEAMRLAGEVGATMLGVAADVSAYARRRERRLAAECEGQRISLRLFPGVTVVDPGTIRTYRVFSAYHRVWLTAPRRTEVAAPRQVTLPGGVAVGRLPAIPAGESPGAAKGGETEGRRRLTAWSRDSRAYGDVRDDLAGDQTSRLSPYLRFGCLSPLAVTRATASADEFVRQLCWRDFFYQVALAFPAIATEAFRPSADGGWRDDPGALAHWQDGLTGVPVVDAGMRQLRTEGWMHNRARMITASFLTKQLGLDWRLGVRWFFRWLLDGDVPNNAGNWQWVAGTGHDARPYRRFNPIRQALRFDPDGEYVRRHVPELRAVAGPAVHQPWLLPDRLDYPPPLESPRQEAVSRSP